MKKITLTSILALCMACPAMANIDKDASTATCDNATIGTTTGPANLQADWTANTINLEWYSEGNEIDVSGTTSASCTYDGGITLPSTPEVPTGYTFGGWRVRLPFDLSILAEYIEEKGTNHCAYMIDKFGKEKCECYDTSTHTLNCTDAQVSDILLNEWKVDFSYGTVKGTSRCVNRLCQCQIIAFDAQKNGNYIPVKNTDWVSIGASDSCSYSCANSCANEVHFFNRRPFYGITQ